MSTALQFEWDENKNTINLDSSIVEYFKDQASQTGISYQQLINFYPAECVRQKKRLSWS